MIDLLLRFPSQQVAAQVGAQLGYSKQDPVSGLWHTTQATLELGICVIGEHYYPNGQTTQGPNGEALPVYVGDDQWWVMVRSLIDMAIPEQITPFIVTPDPENPLIPNRTWA